MRATAGVEAMINILHFADLHLGVETYGRVDPVTGYSTRLIDFLAAFDQLVDYALDNQVDLVLFCGDAYRSRDPSPTYQREFAKRIRRLSANGIKVFLVAGNHDLPNAVSRATAVEIFQTLEIENVTVANRPQTSRIETRNGPVQIAALPWLRRSALMARDDCKDLSLDEINKKLESVAAEWASEAAEALDPGLPAVLAGHLAHSGAIWGSERTMMVGRDYVLLQSNISLPAFDYVALGHIHMRQAIDRPAPIVYPGSLQSIDFGDEGQEKGFYHVRIKEDAPQGQRVQSYQFQPVRARRFVTVKVNAETGDPTAAVLGELSRNDVKDSIVRLQIKMSAANQGLLQENEIRKALKEAHCVAAITRESDQEPRSRLGNVQGITPLEALKVYLESNKDLRSPPEVILSYAERLLQENAD